MTPDVQNPSSIAARRTFVNGSFRPATVRISGGRISGIGRFDPSADVVLDEGQALLPGLVDSHVHFNEPGRTDWEGFETGSAAAAAGGVTTVVEMPLNSVPVTTTPEALAEKRAAIAGKLAVDVAYWGGAVPENLGSLGGLLDAGVVGVKCFLAPSGIDEFGYLTAAQLEQALAELAERDGLLIAHAELEHLLGPSSGPVFTDFVASRPAESEIEAVRLVVEAARKTGARAHIVHVSSAGAVELVRRAKADGVRITIETCPHYLVLDPAELPDGEGRFKCCPPVRGGDDRDALWAGVLDGTIDAIVSDHSPATAELKNESDLGVAWGGLSGVQTGLRAVWGEARRRGIELAEILPAFTTGPAAIVRLARGEIEREAPAHLVVFEPDGEAVLAADELAYRNRISAWVGQPLAGRVVATYLHGSLIFSADAGLTQRAGREVFPTDHEQLEGVVEYGTGLGR
ncbi:allantoinase AllB [Microbacterium indicum]|uniref:allantoinase AllB n=1 Tax=Microbacterium indicum TaxID=358100 RepID=UPI00040C8FCD|nr:allantoinase AllB [Microbacterium indicum]